VRAGEEKTVLIRRAKRGLDSSHPLNEDELHRSQQLHEQAAGRWVFVSERGTQLSTSSINKLVTRLSAGMGSRVQPKSLRHGCGYAPANANIGLRTIMDYMGHRSASSSVLYTALAAERFKEAANVLGGSKGANAPRA
jgi:type 1 fimbriae regulatory protein FimB